MPPFTLLPNDSTSTWRSSFLIAISFLGCCKVVDMKLYYVCTNERQVWPEGFFNLVLSACAHPQASLVFHWIFSFTDFFGDCSWTSFQCAQADLEYFWTIETISGESSNVHVSVPIFLALAGSRSSRHYHLAWRRSVLSSYLDKISLLHIFLNNVLRLAVWNSYGQNIFDSF